MRHFQSQPTRSKHVDVYQLRGHRWNCAGRRPWLPSRPTWRCRRPSAPPESSADCDCGGGGFGGGGDAECDGSHDGGEWARLTGRAYHENVNGIYSCTHGGRIHYRPPADERELSWPLLLPRSLAVENQSGRAPGSLLVNSLQVLSVNIKDIGSKSEDFVNVLRHISNTPTDKVKKDLRAWQSLTYRTKQSIADAKH